MAGDMRICCRLGARSVYTIQPRTSLQCHFIRSHVYTEYVCLAVICRLNFWPNDRNLSGATAEHGGETDTEIIVSTESKLQAPVYDSLPSTTAVFSYVIGSRKLSANEQFFVGVQTVVRLLQTTQIKEGVSFIAASKVYTSTNKTSIF